LPEARFAPNRLRLEISSKIEVAKRKNDARQFISPDLGLIGSVK
jgi:hypothetical protein